MSETSTEHPPALFLVTRNKNDHIGDATQVSDVVGPGVSRTIGAHQARPIECEENRQILQCHIMNQLVISTLQERRINRNDWLEPLAGNTGRKSHGVLFGDAHIEVSRRKTAFELNQT